MEFLAAIAFLVVWAFVKGASSNADYERELFEKYVENKYKGADNRWTN